MKTVINPTLPAARYRKTSLILHTDEPDNVIREMLQTNKHRALKYMGSAGTLERWSHFMEPDQLPHLRTYALGGFHSNDFPRGNPRYAAQLAVDSLAPEWDYLQRSNSPVKTFLVELWCERGNDEEYFTAHRYAAELMQQRWPRLTLAAANTAVGNYNDESVWAEYVNSGLADMPNVICCLHGYGWLAPFVGHLPNWQDAETAAKWYSLKFEDLPLNTYLEYDNTLVDTWFAYGVMRAKYFLDQRGKTGVRFGLSEWLMDDVKKNTAIIPYGGVRKLIREGAYNHLTGSNRDVHDVVAEIVYHGETQLQLLPFIEFAEIFVYNDVDDRFWASDFGVKGALYNKWAYLENNRRAAGTPATPTTRPSWPQDSNIYVRSRGDYNTNIRRMPVIDTNEIDLLLRNEVRQVFGWYRDSNNKDWLQVATTKSNTGRGWVALSVTETNRPFEHLPQITPVEYPNPQEEALKRLLAENAALKQVVQQRTTGIEKALQTLNESLL